VSAVLRHPTARVAVKVLVLVVVCWSLFGLLGWHAVVGVLGGLGAVVGIFATERTFRTRERAAWRAVRNHRDPGSGFRDEADAQARRLLAAPAVDRWGAAVLLVALAIACVVVGVNGSDLLVALPAPILLLLTPGVVLLRRQDEQAADRWLADPPVPANGPDA
jgi:hypothetical protein